MTEFEIQLPTLRPFNIARMHGINALERLRFAYDGCLKWEKVRAVVEEETQEEMFMNAAANVSEKEHVEKQVARQLFAAVILFQASMEAILTMTAEQDERVEQAMTVESKFGPRWRRALANVAQPVDEFKRYYDEIYIGYRNPLMHLGSESDLERIHEMSYRDVYCGIRCGWYAYDRLLEGVGLSDGNAHESWDILCSLVELDSDLYPDDALVA